MSYLISFFDIRAMKGLKHMKVTTLLCLLVASLIAYHANAQFSNNPISQFDASDPATMRSRFNADAEAYFFVAEAKHYSMRFGYDYGLQNQRHLFGLSLPFVHAIYVGDFGGYENTTGVGDLKMRYMFVPYQQDKLSGLQRVSTYLELTAPTGQSELGRGAGTWVYRPGVIFTLRPNPEVSFYPEIKYQFSTQDANILSGDAPDPEDTDVDGLISNLVLSVPVIATVSSWNGWAGLNATYIQSFSEQTYYVFLRLDFGTMIGQKTSAALNITKFIAGQPRLDALVQAKFQFFLR
jgi:Putative MetA-pathway of phenol degradation